MNQENEIRRKGARTAWRRWRIKAGLLLIAAVSAVLLPTSCSTVTRTVMVPPDVPGATFAGNDSCAQCHEQIVRDFRTASHARLHAHGDNSTEVGCESCHGPGSVHNESGGASRTIVNPGKSPEACFRCHLEVASRFRLPHAHPVLGGKVSCSDCHDPHKGPATKGGGTELASQNSTCLRCHASQGGPHVFEHEALRQGCVTCHTPHGSVNQKMLTERNANLCLKCHFQQQTASGQLVIGGRDHSGSMARGTCWSAGCHEAVHGSQVNSSLRF